MLEVLELDEDYGELVGCLVGCRGTKVFLHELCRRWVRNNASSGAYHSC